MVLEVLLDVLEVLLEVLDLSWRSWGCIVVGLPEEPVCEALWFISSFFSKCLKKHNNKNNKLNPFF